jgi:hypothetical protein
MKVLQYGVQSMVMPPIKTEMIHIDFVHEQDFTAMVW